MLVRLLQRAWIDEPLAVIAGVVFAAIVGLPVVPAAVLALCTLELVSMWIIEGVGTIISGCASFVKTHRHRQRQARLDAEKRRKSEEEARMRPERDRLRREEALRAAHAAALDAYRRAVESANRIADHALRDEVIGAAEIKYRERMAELL